MGCASSKADAPAAKKKAEPPPKGVKGRAASLTRSLSNVVMRSPMSSPSASSHPKSSLSKKPAKKPLGTSRYKVGDFIKDNLLPVMGYVRTKAAGPPPDMEDEWETIVREEEERENDLNHRLLQRLELQQEGVPDYMLTDHPLPKLEELPRGTLASVHLKEVDIQEHDDGFSFEKSGQGLKVFLRGSLCFPPLSKEREKMSNDDKRKWELPIAIEATIRMSKGAGSDEHHEAESEGTPLQVTPQATDRDVEDIRPGLKVKVKRLLCNPENQSTGVSAGDLMVESWLPDHAVKECIQKLLQTRLDGTVNRNVHEPERADGTSTFGSRRSTWTSQSSRHTAV